MGAALSWRRNGQGFALVDGRGVVFARVWETLRQGSAEKGSPEWSAVWMVVGIEVKKSQGSCATVPAAKGQVRRQLRQVAT